MLLSVDAIEKWSTEGAPGPNSSDYVDEVSLFNMA